MLAQQKPLRNDGITGMLGRQLKLIARRNIQHRKTELASTSLIVVPTIGL
jgi:hypothetical protein